MNKDTFQSCVLLWLSKMPTSVKIIYIKKSKYKRVILGGFLENLAAVWHCPKVRRVFSQLTISPLNRRLQTQCYPLLLFKTSTTIEKSRRPCSWWSSHVDRGWECWFCFFVFCILYFLPCLKCTNSCILGNFSVWTRLLHSYTEIVKWLGHKQGEQLICPFLYLSLDAPVWHFGKIEAAAFQGPRVSFCGRPKKQHPEGAKEEMTFRWRRFFAARLVKPWRQPACRLPLSPEVKRCDEK